MDFDNLKEPTLTKEQKDRIAACLAGLDAHLENWLREEDLLLDKSHYGRLRRIVLPASTERQASTSLRDTVLLGDSGESGNDEVDIP
jgi:hypothetical protein